MIPLDNSGKGQLQVPGFGDIPLTFELPCQDRFTHGVEEWCQTPAVTLREFAMTTAMDRVTDQEEWHRSVHDVCRLAEWKQAAMAASPLVSDKAWEWCVLELQDKAKFYLNKGFVETLDAERLRHALDPLQIVKAPADIDLVDSCLYPLVYGRTEVLSEGGTTTIDHQDMVAGLYPTAHNLACAPLSSLPAGLKTSQELYEAHSQAFGSREIAMPREVLLEEDNPTPFYWSSRCQSLPCEVSFASEGVSIQSYVNNLHPSFEEVYSCLENLIAASIEPWNYCVCIGDQKLRSDEPANTLESCVDSWDQTQRGRKPLRIITFGVQWADDLPSWAIAFDDGIKRHLNEFQNNTGWAAEYRKTTPSYMAAQRSAYVDAVLQLDPISEPTQGTFEKAWAYLVESGEESRPTNPAEFEWKSDVYRRLAQKANVHRRWLHPEPSTAISYEEWRNGRNLDRAIVKMDDRTEGPSRMPTPLGPTHTPYELCIQNQFREQGLQVIVSIGSIDLDPVSKTLHQQPWQLQGLLNEHIIATSVYIYRAANVAADISFRQETPIAGALYRDDHRRAPSWIRESSVDQTDAFRSTRGDDRQGICGVFGLSEEAMDPREAPDFLPLYQTGQIKLSQGRLVAFPNILETHINVELLDKTLPGQLAYVTINLVGPHYRICSSANVPPQQPHWKDADLNAGTAKASGVRKLREVDEVWTGHRINMKKECQWLNMARYARMTTLGWDDSL